MLLNNVFLLVFFVFVAEGVKSNYMLIPELGGYLKLQRIRSSWFLARSRCHMEGGVLASPENETFTSAMHQMLTDHNLDDSTLLYTGIHATIDAGDFTTVTGTPLSEIDVTWRQGEPDGINDGASCVTMSVTGELGDDSCDRALPYFCYKSFEQNRRFLCNQNLDNRNSDYKFVKRTGSCYKFHMDKTTWWLAYRVCLAEGGYLAIINDDLESQVLKELWATHDLGDDNTNDAFIGVHMRDGRWFTIHGEYLDEAGYMVFDSVTPNSGQSCGTVTKAGHLHDFNCLGKTFFICEKLPS